MPENINPAGYETKPWWPYVMNLQKQIDEGGGGGGGSSIATITIVLDPVTMGASCSATSADIISAAETARIKINAEVNGQITHTYYMSPVSLETDEGALVQAVFSGTDAQVTEGNVIINMCSFDVSGEAGQGSLCVGGIIEFNADGSTFDITTGQAVLVSMTNL